jgi:hypothetical protein
MYPIALEVARRPQGASTMLTQLPRRPLARRKLYFEPFLLTFSYSYFNPERSDGARGFTWRGDDDLVLARIDGQAAFQQAQRKLGTIE